MKGYEAEVQNFYSRNKHRRESYAKLYGINLNVSGEGKVKKIAISMNNTR